MLNFKIIYETYLNKNFFKLFVYREKSISVNVSAM